MHCLIDPEMAAHRLPVLRAADVQEPLVNPPLHWAIKHLKELSPDQWLSAAEPREEGWLQLGCDVTSREALIPKNGTDKTILIGLCTLIKSQQQNKWQLTSPRAYWSVVWVYSLRSVERRRNADKKNSCHIKPNRQTGTKTLYWGVINCHVMKCTDVWCGATEYIVQN